MMFDVVDVLREIDKDITVVEKCEITDNIRQKYMDKTNLYLGILEKHCVDESSTILYKEIRHICDRIRSSWLEYLKGNVESANSKLRNLFTCQFTRGKLLDMTRKTIGEKKTDDPIVTGIEEDVKRLYRCRVCKIGEELSHDQIFHISYDLRHFVSAQRYSIQGFPILYLGNTVDGCISEIGAVDRGKEIWVSEFQIRTDEPIYIADISMMPKDYLQYIVGNRFNNAMMMDLLTNYLYVFPLIIACYYYTDRKNQNFHNEYVVPQMMTHALRNIGAKSKEKACCIRYRSVRSSKMAYNYVMFPPTITVYEQYSKFLLEHVDWSEPERVVEFDRSEIHEKRSMIQGKDRKKHF